MTELDDWLNAGDEAVKTFGQYGEHWKRYEDWVEAWDKFLWNLRLTCLQRILMGGTVWNWTFRLSLERICVGGGVTSSGGTVREDPLRDDTT